MLAVVVPTIYHQAIEKLLARGLAVVLGIHGELLEFLFHDLGAGSSLFKQFLFTKFKCFRWLNGLYDLRLRSFFISLENLVLVALLNAHDLFLVFLMLLKD